MVSTLEGTVDNQISEGKEHVACNKHGASAGFVVFCTLWVCSMRTC